jgi:tetraacyldisaccharide 4'-kinase
MTALNQARLRVARGLERGEWNGLASRALSRAWSAIASRELARPLSFTDGVRVVAIGGATLGGSGKTPLAVACTRALAQGGARVALVGHGYRASPGAARVVRVNDEVANVGDEALVAARALAGVAPVVVASTRQAAIDLASSIADVLLLDGVLQTAPRRVALSLLALDAASPWGAGRTPPRGDLRAPPPDLLAAADCTVLLQDERVAPPSEPADYLALVRSRGAWRNGRLIAWPELAPLRVGLFVALGRPSRLVASLARRGIVPSVIVESADHSPPARSLALRLAAAPVELWLASAKCATHLAGARVPHATLDHDVILDESLVRALRTRTSPDLAIALRAR